MKLGKRVIPFISFEIDQLEDRLQAGENYQIQPCPIKGKLEPRDTGMYDSSLLKNELEELVISELKNKRIRSYLTESELQNALKFVYRTSRTAIEENGANSLFLVLGILKWYETPKSIKPRFAPILLLPIDIIRRGGTNGYVIRTRDEEIILNITLVELLKQQFDINLSGLNPLPKDDSGVDVKKIFAAIRTCIRNQKRWDVVEESMIGLFSFNKFVMWNGIHTNADKLKENLILASLMENCIKWQDTSQEVDAREIDKYIEPSGFAIPIDVDSSQLEAVIESGEGKSFILHGPPGTGKSQTITNMIANALYKGKRVLFVAEKMAALSVVQNRLAKIGLEPFCLELHSNKVTKTHFLAQLQKAIEVAHIQSPHEFENISQQLFERRRKLIDYMEALHNPHAYGYSLFDCITNYSSIQGDELVIDSTLLDSITKDELTVLTEKIKELDTIFQIIGQPETHPLKGLEPYDISLESNQKLENSISRLMELLPIISTGRTFFSDNWNFVIPDSWEGIELMAQMSSRLVAIPYLNKSLLELGGKEELIGEWQEIISSGQERDRILAELSKDYAPEILEENVFTLQQEWKAIEMKWFLPKYFAKRSYLKKLRFYSPSLQETKIPNLLDQLGTYQKQNKIVQGHSSELQSLFGHLGRRNKEKWDEITSILSAIPGVYQNLLEYARLTQRSLPETLNRFSDKMGDDWNLFLQSNKNLLNQLIQTSDQMNQVIHDLRGLCNIELPESNLETQLPVLLKNWKEHLNMTKDWYQWCIRKRELEARGLSMVTNYILNEHKNGTEASNALLKGIYHKLALKTVDADKTLRLFNGLLFEEIITKYKQLTYEFQELSKKELYSRLASRIPSLTMEATSNSEVGILKRNISNGGRGTSIRKLIDQIPTLLPKLCPCMLMSPISVAQYIDLSAEKFDLVIFDEASQMPTNEAVGAIARGKALVVVGDPKQMPPTSFFSSTQVNEEDAEFDDMEERRLNVAVSRARYEMIIFSTLRSDQIDLKRTKAKGVEGLKKFLEFAERGASTISMTQIQHHKESNLVTLIANELVSCGYKVDTMVGRSNFKVDLAIIDPKQPDKYILGILCDGKNYYETKTTRDREIVQPSVLQMLDWQIMRVWSIDWFENKDKVVKRIIDKLESLKNEETEKDISPTFITPNAIKAFSVTDEPLIEVINNREKDYTFADLPDVGYNADIDHVMSQPREVTKQLEQIISIEQPITNTLLYKRILRIWNLTRVTTRLQIFIDNLIHNQYKDPLSTSSSVIFWESKDQAENYSFYRINSKRDIQDIPILEVMNAARYAIEQQLSMPMEDLKKTTSQLLGFSKKGANIDQATELAIRNLIKMIIFVIVRSILFDYQCII